MITLHSLWKTWGSPELTQEWLEIFSAIIERKTGKLPSLSEARGLVSGNIPEAPHLSVQEVQEFAQLKTRLLNGEPVQYIVERAHFFSLPYRVTPAVLIPRPETEGLVEIASNWIKTQKKNLIGIEMGLGSGCISVELVKRFSSLQMLGTELCSSALQVASYNRENLLSSQEKERFKILSATHDPLEAFKIEKKKTGVCFDFLISNPPYLLDKTEAEMRVDLYEPGHALYPVPNRNDDHSAKDQALSYYLKFFEAMIGSEPLFPMAFLEIPHERAKTIEDLAVSFGLQVKIEQDLNLRPRTMEVRRG